MKFRTGKAVEEIIVSGNIIDYKNIPASIKYSLDSMLESVVELISKDGGKILDQEKTFYKDKTNYYVVSNYKVSSPDKDYKVSFKGYIEIPWADKIV